MPSSASIDVQEIARFSDQPQDWWNPEGVWKPLHKLNPVRLDYICQTIGDRFCGARRARAKASDKRHYLKGVTILDIGCGGGLLCEPLARLGASVTGLDALPKAIAAAKAHAAHEKLKITYFNKSAEDFARARKTFDVVLAMEILEHAGDVGALLRSIAALLNPNGIAIFSTVNRTTKSYLLGIVAAEYIMRWVPHGLHDWNKFVKPSELAAQLEKAGMTLSDVTGMVYSPLRDGFSLNPGKVGVNYLASAVKREKI